ncbi:MAG TPA: hypothetical protein VF557_11605 [Jatrophihabitans sp.]|jgi:hypothetical protein|uniref:hypothetical protein n=1 Tax=Jatrophihabitans sp. TaxID=1932789 RepID=UPI002EE8F0E6
MEDGDVTEERYFSNELAELIDELLAGGDRPWPSEVALHFSRVSGVSLDGGRS